MKYFLLLLKCNNLFGFVKYDIVVIINVLSILSYFAYMSTRAVTTTTFHGIPYSLCFDENAEENEIVKHDSFEIENTLRCFATGHLVNRFFKITVQNQ